MKRFGRLLSARSARRYDIRWCRPVTAFLWTATLLAVLFFPDFVWSAQVQASGDDFTAASQKLDEIERGMRSEAAVVAQFRAWTREVTRTKNQADECVSGTQQDVAQIDHDIASLGQLHRGEPLAVTRQRDVLRQQKLAQQDRLATCNLLSIRSDQLLHRLADRQSELLAERLLVRGPSMGGLLRDNWTQPGGWIAATGIFLQQHSGFNQLKPLDVATLVIVIVVIAIAGMLFRQRLLRWAARRNWESTFSGHFEKSMVTSVGHYSPLLFASLAAALILKLAIGNVAPLPFINLVAYGLPAYFLALALIRLFLVPFPPAALFVSLPSGIARSLAARLRVLLLLGYIGYLGFGTLVAQSLPPPALLLARGIFVILFTLNVAWAVWLIGHIGRLSHYRFLRALLVLALLGALSAEVLGYRNLSTAALRALTGTLLAAGLLALVSRLFTELFERLNAGRYAWHQGLRRALELREDQPIPGLIWFRIAVSLLLWVGFLFALMRIWGLSDAAALEVRGYLVDGFVVGSLRVIPARIVLALLVFVVLFGLSGWVRARLKRHWLGKLHLEPGAREAMVTMSGYTGTAIAIVAALSVAGLELSNLAIIAGALSVGIGFGLQNIVNNFISGLILLFERPIKAGDWIVVGSTEGYVRKIRIRSTQIQTFDRADVIVPNSELISGQVTNWMLYDPRGRVRVPVSIAYGSDTGQVKDLLLKIADGHPLVIHDDPDRASKVFFLSFGDSALNFELHCHIGHIDQRLQVMSDLNFAIDAEFRKHAIEMPFPQQDVHVRDWPKDLPPAAPAIIPKANGPGADTSSD